MPVDPREPTKTPDVRTIHKLVRLMQRYDLTAIDLGEGASKIRLRRRGAQDMPPRGAAAPTGAPGGHVGPPQTAAAAAETRSVLIESPMVGTFYASPSPDAAPFVTAGSVVRKETTVCVIEAMKVFTDIPAMVEGTIAEVMVKNGQSVEFGQPLFRVVQE
jgi:acetyl-CoA carboxylase biotin carboxyl carrier protein